MEESQFERCTPFRYPGPFWISVTDNHDNMKATLHCLHNCYAPNNMAVLFEIFTKRIF